METGALVKAALLVGLGAAAWRYKWAQDNMIPLDLAFKYPTKSVDWLREYIRVRTIPQSVTLGGTVTRAGTAGAAALLR